ncbi:hypothetical protein GRI38_09550 [Altererythrobacter aurantiacus]|uniref:Uncharacterized protein n=1 Tax=Parapontixanthobacter aurantiacus TaxID=1463599 RepID=A0A844ZFZ5_9SPHN|nr:hypothetical protein [Parapontixanthobacter aurantiacus]MXO86273.1 hypothetical protein [Parapontixanthobacter aurantiacus]
MIFAWGIVLAAQAAGADTPIVVPIPSDSVPPIEHIAPEQVVVPRDTPVHLMVLNEVSTKDHAAGHKFRLRVDRPIVVDGREVVPVGATAWGEVTDASRSGNVGKSGELAAVLTHIEFGGTHIPLEGQTTADGKSGKGETLLGVLAMGPLGLFAKGNNAKIKAGEKMVAFVAQDTLLSDAS